MGTIVVGASKNKYPGLQFRVDGCDTGNETISGQSMVGNLPEKVIEEEEVFILFKLSNMYYTIVGVFIVFVVGYVVSVLTGGYEVTDERLFVPLVRKREKKEPREMETFVARKNYLNIHEANQLVKDGS